MTDPINTVLNEFFLAIIVYCLCYVFVLFAIFGDLASGVRKAKLAKIARTSYGFRQTINKIVKYYNGLFSASIIDGFLMILLYILQIKGHFVSIPIFPIITVIIGIYLSFVEVRSVFEKLEDKDKARISSDVKVLAEIAKDDDKLAKLLELCKNINSKENETADNS